MRIKLLPISLLLFTASCLVSRADAAAAMMSIDLGSENLKMALIKAGVPMETVLNRESQRKTPFAVTIKQGERWFGSAALKKMVSTATKNTYTHFLVLIGKPFSHPDVQDYQQRFPHIVLKQNEERGSVNFVTDSGEMAVETLLAMILANARTEVEAYAGQPVKDTVIAVPAHFDTAQRRAVEDAANIAGLNLLQMISAGAAAALNYGLARYKDITEEPQVLLIYDVGAERVQATVAKFQLLNETKEDGTLGKAVPRLDIIGWASAPRSGGHYLTLKLREQLVQAFRKQHPELKEDIAGNAQAMAKLLREADRVKQVLSANMETFAQVESVFQDIDFRSKFTRADLEQLFEEFEPRLTEPIKEALKMASLELDGLDRVLLMGAGTRVPRLQLVLAEFFVGKQLGRNLNTDEANALGSVYQAAKMSKNFIVKRFDVADLEVPAPAEGQEEMKPMGEVESGTAKQILADFEKQEKAKAERDHALHQLESAVFDYTYKLEEEEFRRFGTSDELETIGKMLAELREWLEDMPGEMEAEQLKEKRKELMKPIRKLKSRKRQKEDRPEHMKSLEKTLEDADKQLGMFRNTTEIFTDEELATFDKMIADTREWFKTVQVEVEKLADSADATFSTDDLKSKAKTLDREAKFLFNRVIIALRQRDEAERAAKKAAAEEEAAKKRAEEEAKAEGGEKAVNATATGAEETNRTTEEAAAQQPVEVDETKKTTEEGEKGTDGIDKDGTGPVEVPTTAKAAGNGTTTAEEQQKEKSEVEEANETKEEEEKRKREEL